VGRRNHDTRPFCPGDYPLDLAAGLVYETRMDHRTRICLAIILLGLVNYVGFVVGYVFIEGDAMNGKVVCDPADTSHWHYLIGGDGELQEVGRATWIYSAVHSISIWPTMGAVLLAMLTLAKDRIVSAMHSTVMRGRTFMTIVATLIAFIAVVMTVWFVLHAIRQLTDPGVAKLALLGAGL
jgi:hypothetical protein